MLSAEDEVQDGPHQSKKRRMQRACDICRRKKIRCNGTEQPDNQCSNCIASGIECTYMESQKRKESSKKTAASLDNRLNRMEWLLDKVSPGRRNGQSSGTPLVEPATPRGGPSGTSSSTASTSGTVPSTPELAPWDLSVDPSCLVDPDDLSDEEYVISGLTNHFASMNIRPVPPRYIGKSSGFRLLQDALTLKHGYTKDSASTPKPYSRIRPEFWSRSPWEDQVATEANLVFHLPPDDLRDSLINNYFFHINNFYPLIHEPTFRRDVSDGLHNHDHAFANLLLLVCACGSRYSDDPRVLLDGYDSWHSAGWRYVNQVQARLATKSLVAPHSLYDLQSHAVATIFYSGSSAPETGWMVAGIGIRAAQDLGIHRRQAARPVDLTPNTEQWKRAFWVLVALDRDFSSILGRSCAVHDDDFDLDMPVECDDEYWITPDPDKAFKQPANQPSKMAYFIWTTKLDQILAFTHRTIYSINKSKLLMGFVGKEWEQRIVAQLDSALNEWIDSVPDHLRWDPHRENEVFFLQSAYLYCSYYRLQILVHRPFIPKPGKPSLLPSLAICTNAARSYIHVVDVLRKRYKVLLPHTIYAGLFGSCIVILFNIWAGKRSGLSLDASKEMQEVCKGMMAMKQGETRWHVAGRLFDVLCQLADAGDVPLPESSPPPQKKRLNDRIEADDKRPSNPIPLTPEHQAGSPSHMSSPSTASAHSLQAEYDSYLESVASLMRTSDLPIHSDELARLPLHVNFDLLHYNVQPIAASNDLSSLAFAGDAGPSFSESTTDVSYSPHLPNTIHPAYHGPSPPDNVSFNPASPFPTSDLQSFGPAVDMTGQNPNTLAHDDLFNLWSNAPPGFGFDEWGNYVTNVGGHFTNSG